MITKIYPISFKQQIFSSSPIHAKEEVVNLNKTNIFKINFIPSDASNKKLKYESLNTDIVYFKNNNIEQAQNFYEKAFELFF